MALDFNTSALRLVVEGMKIEAVETNVISNSCYDFMMERFKRNCRWMGDEPNGDEFVRLDTMARRLSAMTGKEYNPTDFYNEIR